MAQLQQLGLDRNNLIGTLPPSWGKMAQLQQLYLDSNSLTGPLHPSCGKMAQLESARLCIANDGNRFYRPIPSSWNGTALWSAALHCVLVPPHWVASCFIVSIQWGR